MIDVDIDRLDDAGRQSAFFSIDRPNLFSFSRRDHGARDGSDLREWVSDLFESVGLETAGHTIRLASFPRHLFYKFAPISLWRCFDGDGKLAGIVYEVNNTFGETHSYVAKTSGNIARHDADKGFHVSPFFDVTGMYQFKLAADEKRLDLTINTLVDGERTHMANIRSQHMAATSANLLRLAVTRPLSTLGVAFGIHLEALKLWTKGARYRSRPAPPVRSFTVASEGSPQGKAMRKDPE